MFARALTLHLQICWQIVPGLKFFWSAIVLGWGIPAIGVAIALSLTGVSFRFGNMCHINHDKSLPDFWAPLLAFAASALVIQLVTLGYCVHVYLRSLMDDKTTTDASSGLPSYQGSTHTVTARQRYRRVKKVLAMQWRGVAIVLLIIFNVVLFSTILLSMDSNLQATSADFSRVEPWVTCLGLTQGDKDQCLPLAEHLVTSEGSILAVLIFLSVCSLQMSQTLSLMMLLSSLGSGLFCSSVAGLWFSGGLIFSSGALAEAMNLSRQTPTGSRQTLEPTKCSVQRHSRRSKLQMLSYGVQNLRTASRHRPETAPIILGRKLHIASRSVHPMGDESGIQVRHTRRGSMCGILRFQSHEQQR